MVESLLRSFVQADFVKALDFSTLQLLPTQHVTENWHLRENDLVWQVEWKGVPCLLYLLMEFQKTVHPLMPVRMTIYAGLLWQALWEQGEKKRKELKEKNCNSDVKLMPIFPIVIYNGKPEWGAATSLEELFEFIPDELKKYNPMNEFFLVDIHRIKQEVIDSAICISSDLFYIERMKNVYDYENICTLFNRLNSSFEHLSESLLGKFMGMLNDFLVNTGAIKKGEYITNIKEALQMGIPERVKQMRDEIANEAAAQAAAQATAQATAETSKNKDKQFANMLRNKIYEKIKSRFVSIPYDLIHNISIMNDSEILADFIYAVRDAKNVEELNAYIEKRILSNS